MKKICVIGSLNTDLTVRLPAFHAPGETVIGDSFATYPGGKGGNQAVAAARLGAPVAMVGKLGDDPYGRLYRSVLAENHIDAAGVEVAAGLPSGIAFIEVNHAGENRIIVVPGANSAVDCAQIDRLWPFLLGQDIFLFQLEIPLDTITYAAARLRAAGKTILLDPAPAPAAALPDALLAAVDYLLPNASELACLGRLHGLASDAPIAIAQALMAAGVGAVIAKRGKEGAILITPEDAARVPSYPVRAVDTTAAGDSFAAGFAASLAEGKTPLEAVRFANAVGALSTLGHGAQSAMPSMAEAMAFLQSQT